MTVAPERVATLPLARGVPYSTRPKNCCLASRCLTSHMAEIVVTSRPESMVSAMKPSNLRLGMRAMAC